MLFKIILVIVAMAFSVNANCESHYTELQKMVRGMGWYVTSANSGKHNPKSRHYIGKAIDVRTRGRTDFHVNVLIEVMNNHGYVVLDERIRPRGQKVWGGPHLHIHVPFCKKYANL